MTTSHALNREAQHVSPVPTRKFNSPALGALGFHPLVEITGELDEVHGLASLLHEGCNAA
jgi:hypothetical protein